MTWNKKPLSPQGTVRPKFCPGSQKSVVLGAFSMTTNPFILINDSSDSDTALSWQRGRFQTGPVGLGTGREEMSHSILGLPGKASFLLEQCRMILSELGSQMSPRDGSLCPVPPPLPAGILCLNVELWQRIPTSKARTPCSIQLDICCVKWELIDLLFRLD